MQSRSLKLAVRFCRLLGSNVTSNCQLIDPETKVCVIKLGRLWCMRLTKPYPDHAHELQL